MVTRTIYVPANVFGREVLNLIWERVSCSMGEIRKLDNVLRAPITLPEREVEKLEKSFGALQVLKGIDLEIRKGEVVCIIGASGSGKSTLLRCINLLEEADSGSIWFDGQDLMDLRVNLNALRQKIGMVFQSYDLFPHKTILENVILAPLKVQKRKRDEVIKEAMELLDKVGLASRKDSFPRQLSGGQKQRVAIVRALIMHPEVLLFDEVTAARTIMPSALTINLVLVRRKTIKI